MMNDPSIIKKTESALDDIVDLWKRRKLVCSIVILIIIAPLCFSFYQKYIIVPQLESEVDKIEKDNSKKSEEIQRLETLLTPFKTIALERYMGSEQEVLNKLAQELRSLKKTTDSLSAQIFYKPLSSEKQNIIKNKLKVVFNKTNENPLEITIHYDQGNKNRSLVARDVFNLLKETKYNVWKPSSSMTLSSGMLPSITVKYHPDIRSIAFELLKCFDGYLTTRIIMKPKEDLKENSINITFHGEPVFLLNGAVTFK